MASSSFAEIAELPECAEDSSVCNQPIEDWQHEPWGGRQKTQSPAPLVSLISINSLIATAHVPWHSLTVWSWAIHSCLVTDIPDARRRHCRPMTFLRTKKNRPNNNTDRHDRIACRTYVPKFSIRLGAVFTVLFFKKISDTNFINRAPGGAAGARRGRVT
eukprot:SAG31_NODE_4195_length_3484_cov_1.533235_1_plen_160_part_00